MENAKETKLENLVETLYNLKNGNRIRHLVRVITKAYEENPEKLKRYFNNSNMKVTGIATSVYHFLTGDIQPIITREYGGLGAIINDSETDLEFKRNQLHFSKLIGNALRYSENSGYALWNSENSGDALEYSKNSGDALEYSKNSENALRYSKNSGYALWNSENSGDALEYSKNSKSVKKSLNQKQTQ